MKTIIIGITAIIGLVGGAVSMGGDDSIKESATVEYLEPRELGGEVEYIYFTEPMIIAARPQEK
jgi:hypothetical protein